MGYSNCSLKFGADTFAFFAANFTRKYYIQRVLSYLSSSKKFGYAEFDAVNMHRQGEDNKATDRCF